MKFSICIPNYNYARYLGRTIQSILDQDYSDLEVLISDNASTDDSVALVRGIADPRIHVHVNQANVGFAANLDRAARLATGDRVIMLSSDDLLRPGALSTYRALADALGERAGQSVFSATWDVIDPDDKPIGRTGPNERLWLQSDRVAELERVVGAPVYGVAADELLRRALGIMGNPFNFACTCYPRALYQRVEGYGGGRMINPDKWFNWRLLGVAERAYYVDKPICAYRWHPQNQTAQQAATGALKYLVDEYASTLELDAALLKRIGVDRSVVVQSFVEHDIARHGLATLARGSSARARRILNFGRSVYPTETRRNWKTWALGGLLALGPLGRAIAKAAYDRVGHISPEPGLTTETRSAQRIHRGSFAAWSSSHHEHD
ncbi:MAG TPA: glycosyltransferase family A protein [Gemmatimonadaceae bacterium]|nr:glycosyltransferase family A protein [Gemmatimonadaceae bacterium]